MDHLTLALGLILPWICGYKWLQAIEARLGGGGAVHPIRQLGFGLFIGLALLHIVLTAASSLSAGISYWPIVAIMLAIALVGAALAYNRPSTATPEPSHPYPGHRLILSLLAILCSVHLLIALVDILHMPVYPWDAWLAWIYRAKAWFYSAEITVFASNAQWLNGSELYTIDASDYPIFASTIPLWTATSLGRWSETLVNLPVLLCGLGLAMSMYGSCREYGLNSTWSLLATYILLSIPMVGTHLSLAGYADIWMLSFAGLGMLSLLQGIASQNTFATALGFTLLTFSTQVKHEGFVWLYMGTALVLLSICKPRYLGLMMGAAIILFVTVRVFDTQYLTLPWVGVLGLKDQHIHIPLMQPVLLHSYSLLSPYKTIFFEHGSWHLMAALTLLATASLATLSRGKERSAMLFFMASLTLSQLFIFGFTVKGQWAASYTAINRLPLQLAPAVVFLVILGMYRLLFTPQRPSVRPWVTIALPTLTLTVLGAIFIPTLIPKDGVKAAPPIVRDADQMKIVMGRGQRSDGVLHVNGYRNGFAIASAARGRFDTAIYQNLEIELQSDGARTPSLFWRLDSKPEELYFLDLDNGPSTIDLSTHPMWRGLATELGVTFYEQGANEASITRITLSIPTLMGNISALLDSWAASMPWTQQSVNWSQIGQKASAGHPVALLSGWLGLTTLAGLLLMLSPGQIGRANVSAAIAGCAIIAWLALDTLWLKTRLERLGQTLAIVDEPGPPHILEGSDPEMASLAKKIKLALPDHRQRIAIIHQEGPKTFEALRLKYHLLPIAASAIEAGSVTTSPEVDGYVLLTDTRRPDKGWLDRQYLALGKTAYKMSHIDTQTSYKLVLRSEHVQ